MAYELQRKPGAQRLAEAFEGRAAEFHELSFGAMQDAMRVGGERRGNPTAGLLGQSLHVDGKPVGLDAVLDAPGRFSGALTDAISIVIRMHGLVGIAATDDDGPPTFDANATDTSAEVPKH